MTGELVLNPHRFFAFSMGEAGRIGRMRGEFQTAQFPRISVQTNPSPTTNVVPPLPVGRGYSIDFIHLSLQSRFSKGMLLPACSFKIPLIRGEDPSVAKMFRKQHLGKHPQDPLADLGTFASTDAFGATLEEIFGEAEKMP